MRAYDNNELSLKIISILKERLNKTYSKGLTKRDAHPKCLGLLKAYFIVDKNLPLQYREGVFYKDTYKALIRVSNSNPKSKSDKYKDIRGFSIKLLDVFGEKCIEDEKFTQDFLLVSMKTMPIGTLKLMYDVLYYTKNPKSVKPIIFIGKLIKDKKLNMFTDIIKSIKHDTSPLDINYYSTTPYMFGNRVVKYRIIPRSVYKSKLPKKLTDNYLIENMQKHLEKEEAVFDFMIQFYINDVYTPINDASIEWEEDKSPFIKLGEIRIPKQKFTTKERFELAEKMSFSPGHSIICHKPIGDMNEARVKIYEEMSKYRHNRNKEKLYEPNEHDFDNI